jgi:hypothetical protein
MPGPEIISSQPPIPGYTQRAGHALTPPSPANPESLITDLIGIFFPVGQPAADPHGPVGWPPHSLILILIRALNLQAQFDTSKIFLEKLRDL